MPRKTGATAPWPDAIRLVPERALREIPASRNWPRRGVPWDVLGPMVLARQDARRGDGSGTDLASRDATARKEEPPLDADLLMAAGYLARIRHEDSDWYDELVGNLKRTADLLAPSRRGHKRGPSKAASGQ